jgi:hypothetical protein
LRRITNTITDIANAADKLIQGGQVSDEAINNSIVIGHVRKFARDNKKGLMNK